MTSRPIGVLMLLEAATFATASLIHFDVGIPLGFTAIPGEPFTGAAIPEAIIAGVLLGGALALLARAAGGWGLALTTTLFALAGVVVGLSFIVRSSVSRPGDLVYHLTIFIVLLLTIGLLLTQAAPRRTGH